MDSCSATWSAHTHLVRSSGFWGERVGSSLMNNNALINHLPKSLKTEKMTCRKSQPGAVMNVLTSKNATELLTKQPPIFERRRADPKNVMSVILGGGAGAELFPLTSRTATPAVSVGGCYKLIDIPMSNCINSGINKVYILTQFNSASLNRHIHRTYYGHGINFGDGFVEVLAATQTPGEAGKQWFQGTADAVRQFMWLFEDARTKDVDNILVLSGDHLYRMDYMEFVQNHIDRNADITVSCVPVGESRAPEYGLMKIDSKGQVVQFNEKPKGSNLKSMQLDTSILGLSGKDALEKPYIASMGVYIFKREVLLNLLKNKYPMSNDFGSEIMPAAVKELNVQAFLFKDYWEDIGTLRTFYEANLALTVERPTFEFYDPKTPFYTSPRFLPPTKMDKCKIKDAIISHGCFLRECTIEHSIIGDRSRLDYGVELKDTMMMGSDYYQTESEIASLLADGKVPMGIGGNSKIRNCIIDKNARIGKDVIITNKDGVEEADRSSEGFYIRSGITIVLEKATIPDGTVI